MFALCFFFFSSREINLSRNRKTKEYFTNKAPGNSAPKATETLKCSPNPLKSILLISDDEKPQLHLPEAS